MRALLVAAYLSAIVAANLTVNEWGPKAAEQLWDPKERTPA